MVILMYITTNSIGEFVFYQSKSMRHCWGHLDKNNDYITIREEKKGQVFHFFKNAIAIQLELLEYLEQHECRDIRVRVPDYEKEPFWAVIPVDKFRVLALKEFGNGAIFNYDKQDYNKYGQQIRLPLHCFSREYDGQKELFSYITA